MTNSIKLLVIKIKGYSTYSENILTFKRSGLFQVGKELKFEIVAVDLFFFLLINVLNKHTNKYYNKLNPIIQLQKSRNIFRDVHHMPRWTQGSRTNQLTGKKKARA